MQSEKHHIKNLSPFLSGLFLIGLNSLAYSAQSCNTTSIQPSTPTANFVVDTTNGTVFDKATRLEWKLCAEGMSWNGNTCTGTATTHSWQAALGLVQTVNQNGFASKKDWRLPNIKELMSIVEVQCSQPALNSSFPVNQMGQYWTASASKSLGGLSGLSALQVDFATGKEGLLFKSNALQVRLVRGGQ